MNRASSTIVPAPCSGSGAGFTLIEVLIAMTLLSLMIVVLFSSLSIGAESWQIGERKMAAVNDKAVVYQFFKRHLTTVRPLPDSRPNTQDNPDAEADEDAVFFTGTRGSLQFVSALPAAAARKGLQIFTVGLDPEHPESLLVVLQPFYGLADGGAWRKDQAELLSGVARFDVAYMAKEDPELDPIWLDEWVQQSALPELVRIRIRLLDGSDWPDMIFPLKITAVAAAEAVADDDEENSDADSHDDNGDGN